ncbi:MAG TPA: hypothetical protein VLV83_01010 [Acidobacteriota bacterium]|nr:hypothetical protein [Acidobacteriota bacterium]
MKQWSTAGVLLCMATVLLWAGDWSIVIPPKEEPGQPMVVEGQVFAEDGETPLQGVTVHVYHTDVEGYYSPGGRNESQHRLNGTMVTDAEGRYRFKTIRPAPYPGGEIPAHVHYVISGPGIARQTFELNFADDSILSESQRRRWTQQGTFSRVRPAERDASGVLHVRRDIRLSR